MLFHYYYYYCSSSIKPLLRRSDGPAVIDARRDFPRLQCEKQTALYTRRPRPECRLIRQRPPTNGPSLIRPLAPAKSLWPSVRRSLRDMTRIRTRNGPSDERKTNGSFLGANRPTKRPGAAKNDEVAPPRVHCNTRHPDHNRYKRWPRLNAALFLRVTFRVMSTLPGVNDKCNGDHYCLVICDF